MELTEAQRAVIKAAVLEDPTLAIEWANENAVYVLDAFNVAANPVVIAWRPDVEPSEYREVIVWTEFDAVGAGKRAMFDAMTGGSTDALDFSAPNIRAGLADAFGAASASYLALVALGKRPTTRCEALFAVGVGSNASPAVMGWVGTLSIEQIVASMA